MILAGDVGGTKCNLALFAEKNGKLAPVLLRRFASHEYAQFDLLAGEFLRQAEAYCAGDPIVAAGFGVAGPVVHNRVQATNLPWVVDGRELAEKLRVAQVVLLNDLAATAHSLAHLPPQDFCVLNPGTPEPGGTKALLAAGTGLGQGILFWDGARYRVAPSEGGHSDFAPRTEQQIEFLRFMRQRHAHVTWELILSGRGFKTIHEFLGPAVRHPSFDDPEGDPAPEITRHGLAKTCPVCVATLDFWVAIYGCEAGNLALKVLALGGVYVAGGIAAKIIEKIKDGTFLKNFCDREEKFDEMMRNIPVSVVLNEDAPLLGAAYQALAAARK
ncbi:MAG: glucokinase [Acidobacteriia bacterium]|nr:glucokinase [Terriglobia bacterium]